MTKPSMGPMVGHALFWGWNLLFVAVLWLGLGPTVMFGLFVASLTGMMPWPYAAFGAILLVLPLAAMWLGYARFRHDPGRLLSLLYGVQFPLMLLCLVRIFAVQQLGAATGLALAVIALGGAALLRTLIVGPEEPVPGRQLLRLAGQSAYLLAGLWVAVVVGLYGAALWGHFMVEAVAELRMLELLGEVLRAPILAVWLAFLAMTMAVIAVFPFAMVGISVRSWQLVFERTVRQLGRRVAWGTTAAVLGGLVVGFAVLSRQPHHHAFDVLDAVQTDADRRAALEDEARIRRGLVAAFLASERWLDVDPGGEHVLEMYGSLVGPGLAVVPHAIWRVAMAPFVYQPVFEGRAPGALSGWGPQDTAEAEARYGMFFDVPLRTAERDDLVRAARQTWNWVDVQAGLLDAGQQRVHLDAQELTIEPAGDWAQVTIHDVYRNRTWERQEVFLSFSLPESAVLTGLWLGPVADRDHAFQHVVAPRGAAQEVYKQEVQRRVDPALLEQVGPRQFRLRAFPIEPRVGEALDPWTIEGEGPEMHLWLELVVPRVVTSEGATWPLPVVSEVRNLYWDDDTERDGDVDGWVPRSVPAPAGPLRPHAAVVNGLLVQAEPVSGPVLGSVPPTVRVLVDGTRSMAAQADAVEASLGALRERTSVTVLCTREAQVQRCPDFDAAGALWWGARSLEEQVREAARIGMGPLVVLSDAGSYELSSLTGEPAPLHELEDPLWLVHLGGVFPAAYPDATQDRILQTGGGVASDVHDVLRRLADPSVRDGFRWTVRPITTVPAGHSPGPFTAVAASQAIRWRSGERAAGTLAHLDEVHALAVTYDVVSAFSSMIVLVNDRQREALERAEEGDDRFEREVETGTVEGPMVSSVPEPGTWLLLALGGGLLGAGRRRFAGTGGPSGA